MRTYQIAFCALLALAVPAALGDTFSDLLVDSLVEELTTVLSDAGVVTLPELSGTVTKKVAFVKLTASFLGQGGWLNISSIERSDSSELDYTDDTVSLDLTLELDDISFGFERFAIDVIGITLHGHLNATVSTTTINIVLNLTTDEDDDTCSTEISTFDVTELDGVDVVISGHNSVADWIYNGITNTIENTFNSKIKKALSKAVKAALTTVIDEYDICSLIGI